MPDFASVALSIAMVIGPIIGYVDQYFIIRRKKSSAGFNSLTCGVLLVANILRVFFWFGKRFDTTLFIQSIAMIIAQLILLEIVVRYRHDPSPLTLYSNLDDEEERSSPILQDMDDDDDEPEEGTVQHQRHGPRFLSSIWAWDHYLNYINFLLGLTTVVGVLYLLLSRYPAFVEVLGFVSVGIESTLPVPQCVSNFQRRSTAGFSLLVLASWFFGDSFKLFYFVFTQSPLQFIVCGGVQLSIDMLIVVQFVLFSDRFRKGSGHSNGQHLAITVPDVEDDTDRLHS